MTWYMTRKIMSPLLQRGGLKVRKFYVGLLIENSSSLQPIGLSFLYESLILNLGHYIC